MRTDHFATLSGYTRLVNLRMSVLETTYTYRPSDAVAGRASHGDDRLHHGNVQRDRKFETNAVTPNADGKRHLAN